MSRPSGSASTQTRASTASSADRISSSPAPGGSGEGEVLPHRADEDVVLLGHQRDVAAQVVQGQLDEADPADRHRAGAGRVDARQEPAQGRLAGARRPDHRDALADADVEVDAVQDVAPVDVGEPHVERVELLVDRLGTRHLTVVGHLGDAEQAGQRGGTHLELVEDRDQPVDRVDQHLHVERRRGHLGQRRRAARVEPAAEHQGQHGRDQVGELHVREEHGAQVERVALGQVRLPDVAVEPAYLLVLEPERLDGPGALDGLGEGRVDPGVRRALAQVAVLGAGEVPPQPDHQRRDAEQARERDPPADRDGGHEGQHGGDQRDRPLGQRVADRPAELVDVARGPGEQVARARRTRRRRRAGRGRCRRSPPAARPAPARRASARRSGRSGSAPWPAAGSPPATP